MVQENLLLLVKKILKTVVILLCKINVLLGHLLLWEIKDKVLVGKKVILIYVLLIYTVQFLDLVDKGHKVHIVRCNRVEV